MADTANKTKSAATRGMLDTRIGTVVSDKGDKTITVRYEFMIKHPKYGKYYRRSSKLRTHDEKNEAKIGDRVEVSSCRPYSKTKTWRLARVLKQSDIS